MRRREFITLLGGGRVADRRAGAAAGRAGSADRHLDESRRGRSRGASPRSGFLQGLQETGWVVGRNAQIDIRWGLSGDPERIRKNVTELAALTPNVIFATT